VAHPISFIGENAKAIDRLETTTAENAKLIGENAKAIDRLETTTVSTDWK
jgi:hypothetical protein